MALALPQGRILTAHVTITNGGAYAFSDLVLRMSLYGEEGETPGIVLPAGGQVTSNVGLKRGPVALGVKTPTVELFHGVTLLGSGSAPGAIEVTPPPNRLELGKQDGWDGTSFLLPALTGSTPLNGLNHLTLDNPLVVIAPFPFPYQTIVMRVSNGKQNTTVYTDLPPFTFEPWKTYRFHPDGVVRDSAGAPTRVINPGDLTVYLSNIPGVLDGTVRLIGLHLIRWWFTDGVWPLGTGQSFQFYPNDTPAVQVEAKIRHAGRDRQQREEHARTCEWGGGREGDV